MLWCRSFQELLNNPKYASGLDDLYPRIKKRADSVLSAVKSKAAKQGEFMDAKIEENLKPQVLNEAFAYEVFEMINEVSRIQGVTLAGVKPLVASTNDERADYDQLDPKVIEGLMDDNKGFALQDSFLQDEDHSFSEQLRADVERCITDELLIIDTNPARSKSRLDQQSKDIKPNAIAKEMKNNIKNPEFRKIKNSENRNMKPTVLKSENKNCTNQAKTGWLDFKTASDKYPALGYAIEQLAALPFELNKKTMGRSLNLIGLPGDVKITKGRDEQRLVMDGGTGNDDNGTKVSCSYWLPGKGSVGELRFHSVRSGKIA